MLIGPVLVGEAAVVSLPCPVGKLCARAAATPRQAAPTMPATAIEAGHEERRRPATPRLSRTPAAPATKALMATAAAAALTNWPRAATPTTSAAGTSHNAPPTRSEGRSVPGVVWPLAPVVSSLSVLASCPSGARVPAAPARAELVAGSTSVPGSGNLLWSSAGDEVTQVIVAKSRSKVWPTRRTARGPPHLHLDGTQMGPYDQGAARLRARYRERGLSWSETQRFRRPVSGRAGGEAKPCLPRWTGTSGCAASTARAPFRDFPSRNGGATTTTTECASLQPEVHQCPR
jgi:hypothetical protein